MGNTFDSTVDKAGIWLMLSGQAWSGFASAQSPSVCDQNCLRACMKENIELVLVSALSDILVPKWTIVKKYEAKN